MVQLTLDPVELFLLAQPFIGERRAPKRVVAPAHQRNHRQGVVALRAFELEPRPDTF